MSKRKILCDTVMIECRKITKRLMIHDINIIVMIECCQEMITYS